MRFKIQIVISPWRKIEMREREREWDEKSHKVCDVGEEGSERENMGLIFCLGGERNSTLEYKMISW